MNKVEKILQQYGMHPYQGEKLTSKTLKIYTGNQYVVMKRSNDINVKNKLDYVYKIAKDYQLSNIVPLYLTNQNGLVIKGKRHSYYVMPWLKEKEVSHDSEIYQSLFKEIGTIHGKTKVKKSMEVSSVVEEWGDKQKKNVRKSFSRFERWIASFEAKHFMSPAELLVCYLYPIIRNVCQSLEYWYDEWRTYISDEKVTHLTLCHGQLQPSHLLNTTKGTFLINWEKSFYGEPVQDIASIFYHACQKSDIKRESLLAGLNEYKNTYPFQKSEYASLSLHLLHLGPFISSMKQFVHNRKSLSELEWVRHFQRYQTYYEHVLYVQEQLKLDLLDVDEDD